ncbi:hypothetical protein FHG87_000117 [Trinorchestia longiramus]|nr:hypothetical protein FHG87_000117 [Trinorchestia longiramus]
MTCNDDDDDDDDFDGDDDDFDGDDDDNDDDFDGDAYDADDDNNDDDVKFYEIRGWYRAPLRSHGLSGPPKLACFISVTQRRGVAARPMMLLVSA